MADKNYVALAQEKMQGYTPSSDDGKEQLYAAMACLGAPSVADKARGILSVASPADTPSLRPGNLYRLAEEMGFEVYRRKFSGHNTFWDRNHWTRASRPLQKLNRFLLI